MWRKSSESKLNSLRTYEAAKLMAATTWEDGTAYKGLMVESEEVRLFKMYTR
jgi:hypothetical protein